MTLKYKEFFKCVNIEPEGEWIEVFCSDWNKDYWAFYAYIPFKNYEQGIQAINDLIGELNWRDGDVYIELINMSSGLEKLYNKLYDDGYFAHWSALNPDKWREYLEEIEEEEAEAFEDFKDQYFRKNCQTKSIEECDETSCNESCIDEWAYPQRPDPSLYYDQ